MTTGDTIASFQALFRIALPHLEPPSVQDAARWCEFDPEIVERSILRTARRFAAEKLPSDFHPSEAWRYVTAVARSVTQETGSRSRFPAVNRSNSKTRRYTA